MAVQVGKTVQGKVELAKEHYLVLSVHSAKGTSLAFAATQDYNARDAESHKRFTLGQSVTATLTSLPGPATGAGQQHFTTSFCCGPDTQQ